MVRGYLFIKLRPEFREGLPLVQVLKTADTALRAAYGVQDLRVARAADEETRATWDICLTVTFVSGVDQKRSLKDPISRAFTDTFLKSRAELVWTATFEDQ
jgi:hypothetical protein